MYHLCEAITFRFTPQLAYNLYSTAVYNRHPSVMYHLIVCPGNVVKRGDSKLHIWHHTLAGS